MMHLHIKTDSPYLRNYFIGKSVERNTDSGLDLPIPVDICVPKKSIGFKIPLGICAEPSFTDGLPRGYYLYPRSSTGSKTPLRLSNGTGIIDFGYRGIITACVDNISDEDFNVSQGMRLFQICAHDLSPITVNIAETLTNTERGTGGYGSTGK
tara:strand:+ start:5389 stop:5847 length:459 start_codon:yes stop_codon:yes gene_type:complete